MIAPPSLARCGVHSWHNREYHKSSPPEFIDDPVFYAPPYHRGSAVVGRPYARPFKGIEAAGWADESDLRISFPPSMSWWDPGWTTNVLFELVP
jgi:hypothetical protein